MGRPLGDPPEPTTYREFLAINLRKLATDRFEVGEDFRHALAEAGLDVKVRTIYHWFTGRRFPDVEHLNTIAEVIGVDVGKLLPTCPRKLKGTIGKGQGRAS